MLTAEELVKLIKAHNKLSQIRIPAKARGDVNALIKLVEDKKYKVNHAKKRIEPQQQRGKIIDLKKAEEVLPKPKTELQKQKAQERKEMKEQEKKKELRQAKKEAVEKAMKGKKKSEPKKPAPKKTTAVSTGTQTGRPKVDPKKIKVIEPKKKLKSTSADKLLKNKNVNNNKKNMNTKNNNPLFVVGKKYGTEEDAFKDDDRSTKKNKIVIKVIKRTKKFITFTRGDDDEPIRRSITVNDDGEEYLPYPFKINAKRDLIKD